jgi:hypothetical protein
MNEAIQIISVAEAVAHLLNELANGVKQSFYDKPAHAARFSLLFASLLAL